MIRKVNSNVAIEYIILYRCVIDVFNVVIYDI